MESVYLWSDYGSLFRQSMISRRYIPVIDRIIQEHPIGGDIIQEYAFLTHPLPQPVPGNQAFNCSGVKKHSPIGKMLS